MVWLLAVAALQGVHPYEQLFQELEQLAPRPDRVAAVRDFVLRRDAAEFRLDNGSIALLTSVGGRTVGAAFVGSGSVWLRPPLAVERAQLRRMLGDSVVNAALTAVVFLFADSTLAELERQLSFAPGTTSVRVADALELLTDRRQRQVDGAFMGALLDGDANGYFAAHVRRLRGEGLLFKIDPWEPEEIHLLRRGKMANQQTQTLTQFQRAADLADSTVAERPLPLRLASYQIDATIASDLDFHAAATVHLSARRAGVRWARFMLFGELDVDSVLAASGSPLLFFRRKGSPELWVRLDVPPAHGDAIGLRIVYRGGLIERGSVMGRGQWLYIKAPSTWFPRYDVWQSADMDMTFHTPAKYRFAAIGRLAEAREADGVRTTRWVTELPTQQAGFNIGEFIEFDVTDPRIPPVTVHMNAAAHRELDAVFFGQKNPHEQVAADVANSLSFFTDAFGAPLFRKYYATEIPYTHGQAFPGLIHLSWTTFQSISESGSDEAFRAHEMAHQWWGIGVEPADYRDAWLAEGFSEFAGLWYMQQMRRDNEKYFKFLRESGDHLRRSAANAPPIALGYRAIEINPQQYALMIYQKGAWLLHMLRNIMVDFRTMDESRFRAMLRDFYESHRGRRATTRDFQTVVERHVGLSMAWFFQQWWEGTSIPTYVWSWRTDSLDDGGFLLRIRVRQEGVPPGFVMPVPLQIDLPDGHAYVRVYVRDAVTEADLEIPARPLRVVLNPLHSVLAEVKTERWR